MLVFDNVYKSYGSGESRVDALRGVNLTVPDGEMCAIMGPSGSGKSTLLHAAAGLTRLDQGSILVGPAHVEQMDDDALSAMRRHDIGVVFQSFNLLPYLSALENVKFPLVVDGLGGEAAGHAAHDALRSVGLESRAKHLPHEMSGGERQRIAIARALAIHPKVILADEPTGNLDSAASRRIMDLLRDLNEETGVTMLVITHDPVWASTTDRVVRMVDGAIDQDIPVAEEDDETDGPAG